MIVAPAIGMAPTPDLALAFGEIAPAVATEFSLVMRAVAPVVVAAAAGEAVSPAVASVAATVVSAAPTRSGEAVLQMSAPDAQPSAPPFAPESPLRSPPVGDDCALRPDVKVAPTIIADPDVEVSVDDPRLLLAAPLPPTPRRPALAAAKNAPAPVSNADTAAPVDEDADSEQAVDGPIVATFPESRPGHRPLAEAIVAVPSGETSAPAPKTGAPTSEPMPIADIVAAKPVILIDRPAIPTLTANDTRVALAPAAPEKFATPVFERVATLSPQLMQAARDVIAFSGTSDVRFNVRPDALGPVAVTIERTEAGSNLRLGVESQAAVQAVRQAEPMLNDTRGQAPFVQVSVDLTAHDQRGRQARAVVPARRGPDHIHDLTIERTPVASGRYA